MDLRQIRYFIAACEEGSLSAAAGRLNCTASGVSQQMTALERQVGTSLFERTRRGVTPSAAGRRFYDRCLAILRAVSEAEIELEDFVAGQSGSVSAGFAPGLAKAVLPQALVRFTREFRRHRRRYRQRHRRCAGRGGGERGAGFLRRPVRDAADRADRGADGPLPGGAGRPGRGWG